MDRLLACSSVFDAVSTPLAMCPGMPSVLKLVGRLTGESVAFRVREEVSMRSGANLRLGFGVDTSEGLGEGEEGPSWLGGNCFCRRLLELVVSTG